MNLASLGNIDLKEEKRHKSECVMVEGTLHLSIDLFTFSVASFKFPLGLQYLEESSNTVLK